MHHTDKADNEVAWKVLMDRQTHLERTTMFAVTVMLAGVYFAFPQIIDADQTDRYSLLLLPILISVLFTHLFNLFISNSCAIIDLEERDERIRALSLTLSNRGRSYDLTLWLIAAFPSLVVCGLIWSASAEPTHAAVAIVTYLMISGVLFLGSWRRSHARLQKISRFVNNRPDQVVDPD